jgi:hypothetical protein
LTQRLHHINRKELFAIAHSACKFDDILSRMPNVKHVTMETDSKVASLQLNEFKNYNSKSIEKRVLQRLRYNVIDTWNRWRQMGLSVSHRHIPGDQNKADVLTRIDNDEIAIGAIEALVAEIEETTMPDIVLTPSYSSWTQDKQDTSYMAFLLFVQQDPAVQQNLDPSIIDKTLYYQDAKGIVRRKGLIVIPDQIAKELLLSIHNQMGHASTRDLLYQWNMFHWNPHARKFAKQILRQCTHCQFASNKTDGQTFYGPIKRPDYPFEVLGIDLFGPLHDELSYILTIVDRLTGYTIFLVIPDSTAKSVCSKLELLLLTMGQRTKTLISDNGTQFADSHQFADLLKAWNIEHRRIPIYSPHAGGFYESKHRHALHVIRTMTMQHRRVDSQLLATIASQQINSRKSDDRTTAPHELIFGYEFHWPTQCQAANLTENDGTVAREDVSKIQRARHELRERYLKLFDTEFDERQDKQAERFNKKIPRHRKPLEQGQLVMFVNDTIKKKFAAQCQGPFILLEAIGKHTWKTKELKTKREFILHARRLRRVDVDESNRTTVPQEHEQSEAHAPDQSDQASPDAETDQPMDPNQTRSHSKEQNSHHSGYNLRRRRK